jgi:hypothetical protein
MRVPAGIVSISWPTAAAGLFFTGSCVGVRPIAPCSWATDTDETNRMATLRIMALRINDLLRAGKTTHTEWPTCELKF